MALITSEPRSANVMALTETEVLVLTKENFARNLKKMPQWLESIVTTLANRLKESNDKLIKG